MKNYALLRKTMEHIEAHPEEWDQEHWMARPSCGTTACFAGTALMLSQENIVPKWVSTSLSFRTASQVVVNYEISRIDDLAADELGLSSYEAHILFTGRNSMSDLRTIVDRYLAEEGSQ